MVNVHRDLYPFSVDRQLVAVLGVLIVTIVYLVIIIINYRVFGICGERKDKKDLGPH